MKIVKFHPGKCSLQVRENHSFLLQKTKCTGAALSEACEILCKSLLIAAKTTGNSSSMMMTCFPTFHTWRVPLSSDEDYLKDSLTCACGMVTESANKLCPVNELKLDSFSLMNDVNWKEEMCKLQHISQTKSCLIDSYVSNVSAFRNAVFTAIMMLNVGNCLQDVN